MVALHRLLPLAAGCVLLCFNVLQGETTSQPATEAEAPADEPPAFFRLDYTGDLAERPALTGDWLGLRNDLAQHGISFRVDVVQFGQGNAHGGKDTNDAFRYSGSADYLLEFDTQRMGLWPGGYIKLRGETLFGRSINEKVGSVSPANWDALLPEPDNGGLTTLTEAWIMQFLSPQAYVLAGKVDATRLPGQNVFASDPYLDFINTALWQPPVSFSLVPYSALTAGFGLIPTKWFDMATLVMDAYGVATESGFDTAFHSPNGVAILQAFNFHIKPFGLPGTQRLNFGYSTRDRIDLDDLGRLLISGKAAPSFDRLDIGRGVLTPRRRDIRPSRVLLRAAISRILSPRAMDDDWAFWYDFDQYLYTEKCDPTQGFGIFGRLGWSPGDTNPIETSSRFGFGGKGILPDRDSDRFGLGYYCLNLNDGLPGLLNVSSEQGVELFYNIEVTPWLHITPDFQVIVDPGGGFQDRDVALVYGLRVHMTF